MIHFDVANSFYCRLLMFLASLLFLSPASAHLHLEVLKPLAFMDKAPGVWMTEVSTSLESLG